MTTHMVHRIQALRIDQPIYALTRSATVVHNVNQEVALHHTAMLVITIMLIITTIALTSE